MAENISYGIPQQPVPHPIWSSLYKEYYYTRRSKTRSKRERFLTHDTENRCLFGVD
jgi:hypothetical protein